MRLENLYLVGDKTVGATAPPADPRRRPAQPGGRPARRRGGQRVARRRGRRGGTPPPGASSTRRRGWRSSSASTARTCCPAIYFIFSRNQCDEAAKSCLDAGLRLTTGDERERIRADRRRRLGGLGRPRPRRARLRPRSSPQLEAGIAAHHAGMVPPFKEAVEECFVEGLVKVVFATETLAVGINMPARSVVIEKLTKFTGEHHAFLTPGEYTQLTGRAGRRGIDDSATPIVLWSPFVPFDQVAALASSRSFYLRSAFRPTYNMAANLVRSYTSRAGPPPAEPVVRPVPGRPRGRAARDPPRAAPGAPRRAARRAASPFGDIDEYRATLADTSRTADGAQPTTTIEAALGRLRPGDVRPRREGALRGAGGGARRRPPQGRHAAARSSPPAATRR